MYKATIETEATLKAEGATEDVAPETDATIAAWTSPFWVCNVFPQPAPDVEVVTLDYLMAALERHTAHITEWDSTPLGAAMHAAHILVTLQGADGLWPARLNLRTGQAVDEARSAAPLPLLHRLNRLLYSTEFDPSIRRAEAAVASQLQDRGTS